MKISPTNHQIENDEIDLLQAITSIWNKKWLILTFLLIFTTLSVVIAFGITPIYKADALLQVESKKASIPGLEELAGLTEGDATTETEIQIIKSRKNLGKAVVALKLDIFAQPKKVPILGNFYQHFFNSEGISKPPVWEKLDKYAWGNDGIRIESLSVPNELLNIPLTLISKKENNFTITSENKLPLLEGKVGKPSASKNKSLKIFVSELRALPNTEFTVIKYSKLKAISILNKDLRASEKGKKSGIIQLELTGTNKKVIVEALDHISRTYLEQNRSRSSEEATSALDFLQQQVLPIKSHLEQFEARLKNYRTKNQTADLSFETKAVLDVVTGIDTKLQTLSLQKDELSQRYTANHPTIQAIISQERKLINSKNKALSKVTKLPGKQQKLLKLEGDFKVTSNIYNEILNKIQEYKIAEASTLGNVYIVDPAVIHDKPSAPKKLLIIAIGTLLGLFLGLLVVFISNTLNRTIDNPELLEEITGIPVYSTVPLSKGAKYTVGFKSKKQKSLLAVKNITDPAIESLRSLRTSLHFASLEAKNNIVMITGPSPETGKSFVTSNFAAVIATGDQRVLLIDADMRKGYLHNTLNLNNAPGLSDIISEKSTIDEAIHTIQIEHTSMDVITRGQIPPNPSELLMHQNFEMLLKKLSTRYDLILIDTPPIHAVTDPSIVGSHAGVVFMVIKSEHHTSEEIVQAVKRLSQVGIETKGFIFNGYVPKRLGYNYNYYSYKY